MPFISRALDGNQNAEGYNRKLLESVQYGSVDQVLYMGTREQLAKQIFGDNASHTITKSDVALINAIRRHAFSKPTVVLLLPSNMMGPDILVMVLPGKSQEQPYVEFRVGIKTTAFDHVAREEVERNAITTLLQGAYTKKDGTPRMSTERGKKSNEESDKKEKGKKKKGTLWAVVSEHDTLYGITGRTTESRTLVNSVPTAGNLATFVRMRIELSGMGREDGTQPQLYDDGKVLDILIDKDNIGNVVDNGAALTVLNACISSETISFVH